MAKKITPLTNTQVKQAKITENEYTLPDGDGLQLRIRPNGSKLWVLKYSQPFTKKRSNLGLGKYPDVSFADARKKRTEAKQLLAKDIDPKIHKAELPQQSKEAIENTFGVVAKKWLILKLEQVKPETANHAWH